MLQSMSSKKTKSSQDIIEVSDELFECYENFNICSQIEKMQNLSKKDLYLLLCVCLDKHEYKSDPVVKNNLKGFINEMKDLLDIQNGEKTEIQEIKDLVAETGNEKISTTRLGKNGERLPSPKEKAEARDLKLEQIIKS